MNTRILLFGIILFVAGLIVSAASVSSVLASVSTSPTSFSLYVAPESYAYLNVSENLNALTSIFYSASQPITFVYANYSAFKVLTASQSKNFIDTAMGLEGKGVYEIANATKGIFPYVSSLSSTIPEPIYATNYSTTAQGTYFAIFFNHNSTTADVEAKEITYSYAGIQNGIKVASGTVLASSILMILGLLIIVFSFFASRSKKAQTPETMDENVAKIYAQIEKKAKQAKTKRKNKA
ncbi:MAG: hypothetical protein ACP5T4_01885 [Candidatus Micrarchaeia archaeon]